MSDSLDPAQHQGGHIDGEANPDDVAEQAIPAFPDSEPDNENVGSEEQMEFPLEANPSDVSDQQHPVPEDFGQGAD